MYKVVQRPRGRVEVVGMGYFSCPDRQYVHAGIENCDIHCLLIY